MHIPIITVNIHSEYDVVAARLRARQIASLCGFNNQDQIRIATSVSELARNAFCYAVGGKAVFSVEGETAPQILTIHISDKGPGIHNLDVILSGRYESPTGMGKGLLGARRLMDKFDVISNTSGTQIILQKIFPADASYIDAKTGGALFLRLEALPAEISASEIFQQNQELLTALTNLKSRQDELIQLTRELEDTNRGVVALYAELDEKADHLRRADEMKSRFLSNMSHEFRTPLSSIRALAKLLLDRVDGELTTEQEKQVQFILQSALGLTDLVNDLLDIAKIEAGRADINPSRVDVTETFSTLRGMLRPLLVSQTVTLDFIEPPAPIFIESDEAKLAQILRYFISNALKFTEKGEIKVYAELVDQGTNVKFSVIDTGIGIDESDLSVIFEEFSQVQNALQRKVKGTGLGLPLCRTLAMLLNGSVAVASKPGVGSIFSVTLPRIFAQVEAITEIAPPTEQKIDHRIPILIIEDNLQMRLLYEKFLFETEFRIVAARTLREANEIWPQHNPAAVILDVILYGEYSWSWLAELKNDPQRAQVPIIIATEIDDKRKGLALGADAYFLKPMFKHQLLSSLRGLLGLPNTALTTSETFHA